MSKIMAAKRGTKGDYICHVPKGGTRHGCGAGNKVRELVKAEVKRAVREEASEMAKKHARNLAAHKKETARQLKEIKAKAKAAKAKE
jgi:hypothetical protein